MYREAHWKIEKYVSPHSSVIVSDCIYFQLPGFYTYMYFYIWFAKPWMVFKIFTKNLVLVHCNKLYITVFVKSYPPFVFNFSVGPLRWGGQKLTCSNICMGVVKMLTGAIFWKWNPQPMRPFSNWIPGPTLLEYMVGKPFLFYKAFIILMNFFYLWQAIINFFWSSPSPPCKCEKHLVPFWQNAKKSSSPLFWCQRRSST